MVDFLYVSADGEHGTFYTLEGEGPSAGKPAVFLRLGGCNLTCSAFPCDTTAVWKNKHRIGIEELLEFWKQKGFIDKLGNGAILKLTGGEPTLQLRGLASFLTILRYSLPFKFPIEVETNATLVPFIEEREEGFDWVSAIEIGQVSYICSPKLSNNGDPLEKRWKPEILDFHVNNQTSFFKFVVKDEMDVEEVLRFSTEYDCPHARIWLMPMCSNRQELIERSPLIAELAKKYYFNYSSRLQLLIWNETTGV